MSRNRSNSRAIAIHSGSWEAGGCESGALGWGTRRSGRKRVGGCAPSNTSGHGALESRRGAYRSHDEGPAAAATAWQRIKIAPLSPMRLTHTRCLGVMAQHLPRRLYLVQSHVKRLEVAQCIDCQNTGLCETSGWIQVQTGHRSA